MKFKSIGNQLLIISLNLVGAIICILGVGIPKLLALYLCLLILDWCDIAFVRQILAGIIFLFTWAISLSTFGMWLGGKGIFIMNLSRHYNNRYSKQYGVDFKSPTFEAFEITKEEYYSYNRRFRIEPTLIVLGCIITSLVYSSKMHHKGILMLLSLFIGIGAGFLLYILLRSIFELIVPKTNNHVKVEQYIKQLAIYNALQDEIKSNKNASESID